jgi:hypothetical protein
MSLLNASAVALAASLALATLFAPSLVKADTVQADAKKAQFPMKGDVFVAKVDARIAKAEARFNLWMSQKSTTRERALEIRAAFQQHANTIRSAAARVAADGTVTKAEANAVRQIAKKARKDMRDKIGNRKKNKKGKR